jgi:hypothetical protein
MARAMDFKLFAPHPHGISGDPGVYLPTEGARLPGH